MTSLDENPADLYLQRALDDPVFRLLHDRREMLRLRFESRAGSVVSVWQFTGIEASSRIEQRVGLSYVYPSWFQHCNHVLGLHQNADMHYSLVSPLPPLRHLYSNQVHLLGQTGRAVDFGLRSLLADIWRGNHPLRIAIQYQPGSLLREVLRSVLRFDRIGMSSELQWETADGLIIVSPEESLDLPEASFVDILLNDACEETDHAAMSQTFLIHHIPESLELHDSSWIDDPPDTGDGQFLRWQDRRFTPERRLLARRNTIHPGEDFFLNFAYEGIVSLGFSCKFAMFGIADNDVGSRVLDLSLHDFADIGRLFLLIREVWAEYVQDDDLIGLWIVDLQPAHHVGDLHILIDLRPFVAGTVFLYEIVQPSTTRGYEAEYLSFRSNEPISWDNALAHLGLKQHCELNDCRLSSKGVELLHPQIAQPFNGQMWSLFSFVPLSVLAVRSHETADSGSNDTSNGGSDDSSWMQLPPGSVFHDRYVRQLVRSLAASRISRLALWFLSVSASTWSYYSPRLVFATDLVSSDFDWTVVWDQFRAYNDYYFQEVVPQPSGGFGIAAHFIVFQFSVFDYVPLLIEYNTNHRHERFARLFERRRLRVAVNDIFDDVRPMHACRTESWCVLRSGALELSFAEEITIRAGDFLVLLEITPQALDHEVSTDEGSCSEDEVESFYSENEEVSYLQVGCRTGCRDHFERPDFRSGGDVSLPLNNTEAAQSLIIFNRLPPPGNTKFFFYVNSLHSMDDILTIGDLTFIFDAAQPKACQSDGIPLQLAQYVRPDSSPQTGQNCNKMVLPDLSAPFELICRNFLTESLDLELVLDDVPLQTMVFLENLGQQDLASAKRLEIYTDGSFCPQDDSSGWSFVVFAFDSDDNPFLVHSAWGPVVIDPMQEGWCGASKNGSKEAETEAIIYAVAWRIATFLTSHTTFKFDSTSTGFVAAGDWNLRSDQRHLRVMRALVQLMEAVAPGCCFFEHTPAHTGIHGNELADCLAKLGRYLDAATGAFPLSLFNHIVHEPLSIEWLWLWFKQTETDNQYPILADDKVVFDTNFSSINAENALPQRFLGRQTDVVNVTKKVELGIISFNVCSFKDHVDGSTLWGHAYVREQLVEHGVHVACFQETRIKRSGLTVSNTHIRCTSAAFEGRGGSEIWLLRREGGSGKTLVGQKDILVLEAQSELLALKVAYASLSLFIVCGHGPQSGRSEQDIDAWWWQLRQLLQTHYEPRYHLILGLDANAHFNVAYLPMVGEWGLEDKENRAARRFVEVLQAFSLFLPSTFQEHHIGSHTTWRRTSSAAGSRCDYIAVPACWSISFPMVSKVLDSLDAGSTPFDHTAIALWVNLTFIAAKRPPKASYDREALKYLTTEQGTSLAASLPEVPWQTNVHTHAVVFSEAMHQWLVRNFPAPKFTPKAGYISEDCWKLRQHRMQLQRRVRQCKLFYTKYQFTVCLYAWKHGITMYDAHDQLWHFLFLIFRHERLSFAMLRDTKNDVRKQLRKDRTSFLEKTAVEAINAPHDSFFKILKKAGVVSAKYRSGTQPLPRLRLADGTFAVDLHQISERWRSFFSQQEDGCIVTTEELASQCEAIDGQVEASWHDIPSLLEYELAMKKAKPGKALYYDELPGEMFRYAAGQIATKCYPLFFKQCLTGQEPLLFRGGRLTQLFKGKGDPADCSSFRSIFISPVLGKIHHSLFRSRLSKNFEHFALPLQLGGRPSKGVSQASLALQLLLAEAQNCNRSTLVVFIDIANAFYKVLRQHVFPTPRDLRTVDCLFRSLGLDSDAMTDFLEYTQQINAVEQAAVPAHLQRVVINGLSLTWFCVEGSKHVTQTRKGSRPGDCYADLVFSYAFTRLVHNIQASLTELGLIHELRWSGVKELVPSNRHETANPLGPIWADDLAIILTHSSAETLFQKLPQALGMIVDKLSLGGMAPNLGPGKTELLAAWRGPGSRKVRRSIAGQDHLQPTLAKLVKTPLRYVGSYKRFVLAFRGSNMQPGFFCLCALL